jgi:hypothetical protein
MPVESLRYSIPYISLVVYFILLFITEYLVRKQAAHSDTNIKIIRWAGLVGLLFFFGLRGFIGWDWTIYYPAFKSVPDLFSSVEGIYTRTRFEVGFVAYMSVIKSIWNNYHFFIFVNTLLDILILNLILKQFSRISFSISCLLFVIMGGFYLETDLLRNAKSIMLFLLSLQYIRDRKIVPFFILNIVGCMFHISAVLYLPLYFFMHRIIPRKIVLTIFLVGIFIFLIQFEYVRPLLKEIASLLGERYTVILNKYLSSEMYSSGYGITIGFIERIITSALIIIYYNIIIKQNRHNILFINGYILFFIIFFYFSEIKIIPVRVGMLFSFGYWIIYPAIFKAIEKINNRIIFIFFIFIYSLIKIAGMTDNLLYRYTNILFGQDDILGRQKIFDSVKEFLLK